MFYFDFSVTIPLLACLNLKWFLERLVSLYNYMSSRRTTILILIETFGDVCLDIGSSTFMRLWSLPTKLMRSRMQQFWGGNAFLILSCGTLPKIPVKTKTNKQKAYKIYARKKWNSVFLSLLPFQNRSSVSYRYI